MINEVIQLRKENPDVTLTTYVASDNQETPLKRAIIICPGGSYKSCADHEGEKIALNYMAAGINAFVLNYSTTSICHDMRYPMPLVDVSNAMKHIKDHAEKYHIDKEKVFVCGFSAGGHLASMLGTIWHREEVYAEAEKMEYGYNKPAGMILCYPVINPEGHLGSFKVLLNEDEPTEENLRSLSSDLNVDDRTCPAFIWHAADDISVDAESSVKMALALKREGIKFELHIYPEGGHGLGYPDGNGWGKYNQTVAKWFKQSTEWIKSL